MAAQTPRPDFSRFASPGMEEYFLNYLWDHCEGNQDKFSLQVKKLKAEQSQLLKEVNRTISKINRGEILSPRDIMQDLVKGSEKLVTKLSKHCSFCQKRAMENETEKATLKICSRCKDAFYCNETCQKAHWPEHKKVCHVPKKLLGTS